MCEWCHSLGWGLRLNKRDRTKSTHVCLSDCLSASWMQIQCDQPPYAPAPMPSLPTTSPTVSQIHPSFFKLFLITYSVRQATDTAAHIGQAFGSHRQLRCTDGIHPLPTQVGSRDQESGSWLACRLQCGSQLKTQL